MRGNPHDNTSMLCLNGQVVYKFHISANCQGLNPMVAISDVGLVFENNQWIILAKFLF